MPWYTSFLPEILLTAGIQHPATQDALLLNKYFSHYICSNMACQTWIASGSLSEMPLMQAALYPGLMYRVDEQQALSYHQKIGCRDESDLGEDDPV